MAAPALPVGADDIAFLFAADAGVFVATSAGNSGPGPDTVGSPGNAPWITTVGANTQPRFFEGEVRLRPGDNGKARRASTAAWRRSRQEAALRVRGVADPGLGQAPFVDAEDSPATTCA